ncbi:MAG TPA: ATP-binding cassette domain-containing protein [Candidatus Baltobacteraceae bacterium]|jgi:ABC-2 type transport system ATP-binding protein
MALEVDHVRRSFGSVPAVRDVNFSVTSGTTFGLLGPNGAGKTTTMRMILGILVPDGGSVRWRGAPIDRGSRRHFGYLPEERGLYGKLKVKEQIIYFARLHGLRASEAAEKADRWIADLGLAEYTQRPCGELSKGNQQKVQVACAAAHGPDLLILDEPFSGLDPVNAQTVYELLETLRKNGTTLVLSSHQMWQLETLCDSFCIIADGTARAAGTLASLRSTWPTRTIVIQPDDSRLRHVFEMMNDAEILPSADGELRARVPSGTDFAAVLRNLVAAAPVTRFEPLEPSLEEIYRRAVTETA